MQILSGPPQTDGDNEKSVTIHEKTQSKRQKEGNNKVVAIYLLLHIQILYVVVLFWQQCHARKWFSKLKIWSKMLFLSDTPIHHWEVSLTEFFTLTKLTKLSN